MARIRTASFAFFMLAFPALGAGMADTASRPAKTMNGQPSGHAGYRSGGSSGPQGRPQFWLASETALLDGVIDKVCIAQPDAKVIDAVRLKK